MKLRAALLVLLVCIFLIPVGCGKNESRQAVEFVSSLIQPVSFDMTFARISLVSGIPPSNDNNDDAGGDSYAKRYYTRSNDDQYSRLSSYSDHAVSSEFNTFSSEESVSSQAPVSSETVSKTPEPQPVSAASESPKESKEMKAASK